jgi:hypothetical protein
MNEQIITLDYICDEILKNCGYKDHPHCQMNGAEIMTTALVAALFFQGHHQVSQDFLKEHNYIPDMLSSSRFNRRLHQIPEFYWQAVSAFLGEVFKAGNETQEYVIDSFPISVCKNIRISRCRIYQEEEYRGYCAAKKEYFYGLRVHAVVTERGELVQWVLAKGSQHDMAVFKDFPLDLPKTSILYGDKAYNDYQYEEFLLEALQVELKPLRRKNSKRAFSYCVRYVQSKVRKIVETVGSQLNPLLPKTIHAVTARGFELKVG